jgi:hypothetical protein
MTDRPWNHYVCETCHNVTVTFQQDAGVTPMFVRCRARPGCTGMAQSQQWTGPQDATQRAHLIWYRPATRAVLEDILLTYPISNRRHVVEHWTRGGCLFRDGPAILSPQDAKEKLRRMLLLRSLSEMPNDVFTSFVAWCHNQRARLSDSPESVAAVEALREAADAYTTNTNG